MSTVRTTTTRTTVVTTSAPMGANKSVRGPASTTSTPVQGTRSYSSGGRSGGGRARTSSRRSGGGSGCNCGGNGGGCLAAVSHWLALAAAIIIIVAWIFRFIIGEKKHGSAPHWFEFLLLLFLGLMIILGGFGIGGLDSFLEEYLQLTISVLGKGMLLLVFCARVYADKWGLFTGQTGTSDVFHTLASLLCCVAAVLAFLVLLVGLGVAK